ncbi:twin-arginine translocation signal domain-containing protein [Iamia sp.]|uniref:twin-arginine translocation signal domain-containing protein n=1 Tax=Iamia sp. TaxID=2722710 RepID=UPI002BA52B15|nr:twin-arginine translocation signal domain-containing protein [Iamia sp.]HXH58808.1 twin-arginine translocation signal domain-containing protein [Iamia sp.]
MGTSPPRLPVLTDRTEPLLIDAPAVNGASRRRFLARVAAGGAVLAAGTQLTPLTRLAPFAGAQDDGEGEAEAGSELTEDETRVAFLAGLALACTEAYAIATDPTSSPLPEPVLEVVRSFGLHHSGQADELNDLLPTAVEEPNATLLAELQGTLGAVTEPTDMLTALGDLETSVAATHFSTIGAMEDQNDAQVVAATLPVVAQHAVVLGSLAGVEASALIPDSQSGDGTLSAESYPAVRPEGDEGSAASSTVPDEDPEANEGGEGVDPGDGDSDGGTADPGDGTESSGGGADDGSGSTATNED